MWKCGDFGYFVTFCVFVYIATTDVACGGGNGQFEKAFQHCVNNFLAHMTWWEKRISKQEQKFGKGDAGGAKEVSRFPVPNRIWKPYVFRRVRWVTPGSSQSVSLLDTKLASTTPSEGKKRSCAICLPMNCFLPLEVNVYVGTGLDQPGLVMMVLKIVREVICFDH